MNEPPPLNSSHKKSFTKLVNDQGAPLISGLDVVKRDQHMIGEKEKNDAKT